MVVYDYVNMVTTTLTVIISLWWWCDWCVIFYQSLSNRTRWLIRYYKLEQLLTIVEPSKMAEWVTLKRRTECIISLESSGLFPSIGRHSRLLCAKFFSSFGKNEKNKFRLLLSNVNPKERLSSSVFSVPINDHCHLLSFAVWWSCHCHCFCGS